MFLQKLSAKELVKLNFHKNSKDEYHCPVTFKIFNENTHIVAIKPTGNVFAFEVGHNWLFISFFNILYHCTTDKIGPFSLVWIASLSHRLVLRMVHSVCHSVCHSVWLFVKSCCCVFLQAVERLNFKPKFLKDLITDEPFTRDDVITIQVELYSIHSLSMPDPPSLYQPCTLPSTAYLPPIHHSPTAHPPSSHLLSTTNPPTVSHPSTIFHPYTTCAPPIQCGYCIDYQSRWWSAILYQQ